LELQKAAAEADLQFCMLSYYAVIVEARRRRAAWLKSIQKGEDFTFDHNNTQLIWKQWQDEWQANEERRSCVQIKNPRSMFDSYCYNAVGIRHLVWLVLQTGRNDEELLRYITNDALLHDMHDAYHNMEPKCRLSQKARRKANRKERQKNDRPRYGGQEEGNTRDEIKPKQSAAYFSQRVEICTVRRILNELTSA
jgi:hypothetical protein